MTDAVRWTEETLSLGVWEDDGSADVLIGHDYGGTQARTGIYIRESDGSWTRARVGSIRHEGQQERVDAGVAAALAWVRNRFSGNVRIRLGVGCKGPTDIRTGHSYSANNFPWGDYNVIEHYDAQHPGAFDAIIAANDLLTCALGAVLSEEVRRQLHEAISRWNVAHPNRPIPTEALHRDVVVISLGTGAGYKVIHPDGRLGEGGEIWTLYAPIDRGLFDWLWDRIAERETPPPNVELFVSGKGLPLVLEYLVEGEGRRLAPDVAAALERAADLPAEISRQAQRGCPTCRRVFLFLAVHLASLAQSVVQAHKPRSLVLSGGSLIVPNWEILEAPFFRYFRREFDGGEVEFPLVAASGVGLVDWARATALAVDRTVYPGIDGAAYLAAFAEFYRR